MRHDARRTLIIPSVLDRLLDDCPDEAVEGTARLAYDLPRYKRSVARDLEALLNSRCIDLDEDIGRHPEASDSMLDFGIIDLSSLSLLDPDDRSYLRDKIRVAIERHEPRLDGVKVALDTPDGSERLLRFRVDAVLKVHPARPPVAFDAMLQLSTSAYQVREN